jgi:hypothetical protein
MKIAKLNGLQSALILSCNVLYTFEELARMSESNMRKTHTPLSLFCTFSQAIFPCNIASASIMTKVDIILTLQGCMLVPGAIFG